MPTDLKPAQIQQLRNICITATEPGTILRDVESVLNYVQTHAVEAGSGGLVPHLSHLLPLNQLLVNPDPCELKRPQLRSLPTLQLLFTLMSNLALLQAESPNHKRRRLSIRPESYQQWRELNPCERYFQLVESIMTDPQPLFRPNRLYYSLFVDYLQLQLRQFQFRPRTIRESDPESRILTDNNWRCRWRLGALFGWHDIQEQQPDGKRSWLLRLPPAGLLPRYIQSIADWPLLNQYRNRWGDEPHPLQPLLQPLFPQWQRNLAFPRPEVCNGTFICCVCLDKVQRRLAVPATANLHQLSEAILAVFDFDDTEHLYRFTVPNLFGTVDGYTHPENDDDEYSAAAAPVGTLGLRPGDTVEFLFDYSANWIFTLKLEKIEPPWGQEQITLLSGSGDAPPQYQFDNDDDEDYYDDDLWLQDVNMGPMPCLD